MNPAVKVRPRLKVVYRIGLLFLLTVGSPQFNCLSLSLMDGNQCPIHSFVQYHSWGYGFSLKESNAKGRHRAWAFTKWRKKPTSFGFLRRHLATLEILEVKHLQKHMESKWIGISPNNCGFVIINSLNMLRIGE